MKKFYSLLVFVFLAPIAAMAGDEFAVPTKIEVAGFEGLVAKTGGVYLASQPSKDVLKWAKNQGVTTIINLRSDGEMERHTASAYDEAATLSDMGLKYVHIPLGGKKHPYNETAVEAFAAAMAAADNENVLVHCASAGRVSYMWAAWLTKHQGMSVNEAVEHARAVNFGTLPLERLLGSELEISAKPD